MLYKALLRPLLFRFPPETVHGWALHSLGNGRLAKPLGRFFRSEYPALERKVWGLTFPNPVGLAAGFDKNGIALCAWEKLGFGFVELGTVTLHSQPGNRRPRLFRLGRDQALINRLGFPNEGAEAVAARLRRTRAAGLWPTIPVGINIGKSKVTPLEEAASDYVGAFRLLRDFGDYFVVNVSSPNTPGLRSLQSREQLARILDPLQEENAKGTRKPILVKIAPDLREEDIDAFVDGVIQSGCDGIVATNTTVNKSSVRLKEEGGLSGQPLRKRSTAIIRLVAQRTGGKLPIIGVGGIFCADDAREKLNAGATLVQAYTGLIYEGPRFARNVCDGLIR
jgi:dihydroorotate dehydrogenase